MSKIILVLIAVILSGCSGSSAPEVVKTVNTNQVSTNLNSANVAVVSSSNTAPITPATITNNPPLPTVNNNPSVPATNDDKKPSNPVKVPTTQIGSGGNDMFLLAQMRGALSSDEELLNSVIVEIKEGNAVLTGNVSSEAQKTKAAQLIGNVKGLKGVKNNLRVAR